MKKNNNTEIIEKGNIYFFYRPKMNKTAPKKQEDVQRTYFVLSPENGKKRLIVIGQKELPKEKMNKNWAFIDKVGSAEEIKNELSSGQYETKTRGKREVPATRPAGEGVYEIVKHGNHTHLAYILELPKTLGKVQKELKISKEGNFIITVKNPEKPGPGLREEQEAEYPETKQKKFQNKRFATAEDAGLLDFEGSQIILVNTGRKISSDLGVKLNAKSETESSAEIFRDLRLDKHNHPIEPLFRGEWR